MATNEKLTAARERVIELFHNMAGDSEIKAALDHLIDLACRAGYERSLKETLDPDDVEVGPESR